MKIIERNLQEIGNSLLVTLPKEWTKTFNLKKGAKIKMMISEQGNLSIAPEFTKQEEKKESTINYDQHFPRKFFKEYFSGNEKITISIDKNFKENERKPLYLFLKKFMNAQIIEETPQKIVVKIFRIDELSIEECLKRMYFLSLNMIDEVCNENDKTKLNEMEDGITKFYYMLVMQIRRFFQEGKFAEKNQVSMIRALDYRMIAEKIERIGDILKEFNSIKNTELIELFNRTKNYYSKAFMNFTTNNYENALLLWSEEKKERMMINKTKEKAEKTKNIYLYDQTKKINQILSYAKEISMLAR